MLPQARSAVVLAIALMSLLGSSQADTYILSFDSLAAQDGQTIYYYRDQGWEVSSALGFTVIGPASPYYTGSVGLIPIGGSWAIYDATTMPLAPATDGSLAPYEVGIWVASSGESNYNITIAGFSGTPPLDVWQDADSGSLLSTPAQIFGGSNGLLVDIVAIVSIAPYQFTELDLSTGLIGGTDPGNLYQGGNSDPGGDPGGGGNGGIVSEPVSGVLLLIGLFALAGVRASKKYVYN